MVTTIFDVAREAGVSTSTVSRVMNGNERVDPQLTARVTRARQEAQLPAEPNSPRSSATTEPRLGAGNLRHSDRAVLCRRCTWR